MIEMFLLLLCITYTMHENCIDKTLKKINVPSVNIEWLIENNKENINFAVSQNEIKMYLIRGHKEGLCHEIGHFLQYILKVHNKNCLYKLRAHAVDNISMQNVEETMAKWLGGIYCDKFYIKNDLLLFNNVNKFTRIRK